MSIYRKSEIYPPPRSDVHAEDTIQKWPAPKRAAPPGGAGSKDPTQLRRYAPANVLIPPTVKWVESLPANVRPNTLLRQYARIANLIAAAWKDRQAFDSYMQSLLTDKRGNRKGFPKAVMDELIALQRYHAMHNKDDNSVWSDVGRRS